MTNCWIKLILLNALIGLFTISASAWDDTGHKTTAYIAWHQMTPDVREKVFEILMKAPEDSDLNVLYMAFDSRNINVKRLELFMAAATWADMIRNRDFKVRYANYHKGDWHYADIFWKTNSGGPEILMNFPEESGKAIPKLYDFEKILRDTESSDSEKAVALAWFLHVGGDIHNPLHNASRVTDLEPKGDQGGNMFLLTPSDAPRRLNLHSYWDGLISSSMPREGKNCDFDYIEWIAGKLVKKFPYSKMKPRIQVGEYQGWNKEGFDLLTNSVYPADLKRGVMPSKGYEKKAVAIGQEQIALAGYRLGDMLNSIFGKNPGISTLTDAEKCKIIRNILYPVEKRPSADQKIKIAVLNICPLNQGKVARPVITLKKGQTETQYEFDVVKVFDSETEARQYAKAHNIVDAQYN